MIMQIKQLKSIINGGHLSPWSDELDVDAFLAPPPAPPLRKPPAQPRQEEQQQQRMEEEAKKTLLNIDSDKKRPDPRHSLARKAKKQFSQMSVQEAYDFKLPPIARPYDSIDYAHNGLLPPPRTDDEQELFRKHGSHRKSKARENGSKVERSISYGPNASRELQGERRGKAVTLEPLEEKSKLVVQLGGQVRLRMRGKKYSFQSRVESERQLSSDQYKYIPSQPNITPHHLLFGHDKQDVLKKVLQQLNQKIK